VYASEIVAPDVFASGRDLMPQNTDSFAEGFLELLENSIKLLEPNLQDAFQLCGMVVFSTMVFSVLPIISPCTEKITTVAGSVSIAAAMFLQTNGMLETATRTVRDILDYGKLLCQVMTAALAAQGGVTASSALYVGTTLFLTILNFLISKVIIPLICFYLVSAAAYGTLGEDILKKTADMIKGACYWTLKTLLMIFTTYMTITGTVSGTTDIAAMKATKVLVSSAVPIVGGILADSSEAVLVSMGIIKNAAGIYGILAVLAVFMGPFIKIGMHHLLLKATSVICGAFGDKRMSALVESFSVAMSILLAVIGTGCVLILISTVCFLKGAA
jgi:stage III sporulation protein AE